MNRPISFTPDQRLTALLRRPGGLSAEEAVRRANERLAAIRNRCVSGLDDKIDALVQACRPDTGVSRDQIIALASEIFAVASLFNARDVAHASGCMCDLLLLADETEWGGSDVLSAATTAPVFMSAVLVHVEALRRLRQPERGGDENGRAAIVAGLRKVTRKFIPTERALEEDLCDVRAAAETEVEPA
jgi:hypothetical protein